MNSNSKKNDADSYKDLASLFLVFGAMNLLLVLFVSPLVLRFFSFDHILEAETIENIRRSQFLYFSSSLLFLAFGYLSYKMKHSQFLKTKTPLASLWFFLIFLLWMVSSAEVGLGILPLPSTQDILDRSILYEPSAFSTSRLATFGQNIQDNNGSTRFIVTNGYRGEGFPIRKPNNEIRIVIMGGSQVFNAGAPLKEDWPHQIEQILHRHGHENVRVINAGVPGHRTPDSIGRLLSEIHFFDPDYILLCQGWNDIKYFHNVSPNNSLLRITKPLAVSTYRKPSAVRNLFEKSQLYLRSATLLERSSREALGVEGRKPVGQYSNTFSRWGLTQYKLNLETFVDLSRNIGAKPILLTQPRLVVQNNSDKDRKRIQYDYVLLNHDALYQTFEEVDTILMDVARQKDAHYFDLARLVKGQSDLFVTTVHLSGLGGQSVARATANYLESLIEWE